MTNPHLTLKFDIQSPWHIGSGEEGGAYADALALRNHQQLPYLPGRSVKGLLREACQQAAENQWFDPKLMTLWFGDEGTGIDSQGLLIIESAELSRAEQQYLTDPAQRDLLRHLSQVQQMTAIDAQSGVAKNGSLRSIETIIPMTLHCQIQFNASHPEYDPKQARTWLKQIAQASSLIFNLGARRHRGFGQVFVHAQVA